MKLIKFFICGFLALSLTCVSTGYAKEKVNKDELIMEVFSLSGMDEQIELIPDQVKFGFGQSADQLQEDLFAEILSLIDQAYKPSDIKAKILADLNKNYDQEKMLIMRDHLKTPLIQRLTSLELRASDVDQYGAMADFMAELQVSPPAEDRVQLMSRVDLAVDASEITTQMALLSQRVVMRAINGVMPEEKQLSEEQLGQFENDFWVNSRDPIKENVLVTLLFAYRDVSIEDLQTYLNVLESDEGQWFFHVLNTAFMSSMETSTNNFGQSFQAVFKRFFEEAQAAAALAAEENQGEAAAQEVGVE